MSSKGLDSAKSLATVARALVADGYTFVCRYYFNTSRFKDQLTHTEAFALTNAGLWIVSVYESGFPTQESYFTAAQGHTDAAIAYNRAVSAGQPSGTVIYFAVDCDARPDTVVDYFQTVNALLKDLGGRYTAGVYGSGAVCERLKALGLVSHCWLAQSTGWRGFDDFKPHANIVQGHEATVHGLDVDLDESFGNGGGWKAAA